MALTRKVLIVSTEIGQYAFINSKGKALTSDNFCLYSPCFLAKFGVRLFRSLCCGLAHRALALWLLFGFCRNFLLHSGEFGVDHDASAVFADNDFLVHLDVELSLWRNLVEASAASICLLYTSPSPRD